MTEVLPKISEFKEMFLQMMEVVPCLMNDVTGCLKEAVWNLTVTCPCRKYRYPYCDYHREVMETFLKARNCEDRMTCTRCKAVAKLEWRPL